MNPEKKLDGNTGGVKVSGGQINVHGDMVGRDKIVYEAPAPVVPALHQLPPPPGDFTGRAKELSELTQAVEKSGVTISGLQGMGGVGKTALALKLAEQLTARYPDAQFYLDLKGVSAEPLTPKEALAHVIRGYHPDIKPPESEVELGGLYRSVLHNQRALVLMDNAKDAQQVAPLIPPLGCLLLVTSRQQFTLPGLVAKNLEALPAADARALMLQIAPRLAQDRDNHADVLAKLCGYLPLALRTVGSALGVRKNLSPADYTRKLTDSRERLKLTATEASLGLSYELLAAEVQKRFRALAVFPDEFDVGGAAAVWEAERDLAQEALGELLLYSLLEFNAASARYRLHDLVRLFADARLDKAERVAAQRRPWIFLLRMRRNRLGKGERVAAQRRHAEHYKNVAAAANELYKRGGEWLRKGLALFDAEWGNIQGGQAWAAAHAGEDEAAAVLCSAYPDAGLYCLHWRLHPREQIRWREAALAAARQLGNRGAEGSHLGNLGLAYYALDALGESRRAIEYHKQCLQIAREIGDRRGAGQALGNLGLAYYALGEYRRAIEYYEQDLQIAHEIGDRRGEGQALGNLGNAYYSFGEYRRDIEYHEQALTILREIGDRHGEATAVWNMSLTHDKLGERARAIPLAEAALRIYEQIESPYAAKVRARLTKWRK